MTSQPQSVPGERTSAGEHLRPLRDLAVYALAGAAAVLLFVAVIRLIPDSSGQFGARTRESFAGFVNLATILFPLGAVLLALFVAPRHPKARLIVLAALVEYAVAAFFGVLFGVLIGLTSLAASDGARAALEGLLVRVAWLAVFGVAAYAVLRIWRTLFHTPRPKSQPGVYGQSQYGTPAAYPNQPGYGPPAGQPGYPPSGPTYAPQPDQPQPQPGVYGRTPGPYAPQPDQGAYGPADQTQAAPHPPYDRTERFGERRPGFGPADGDPPRR